MSDGDKDTPAVLPYRVGQVEKQLVDFRREHNEAFTRLELKLDSYAAGFITQKQFETAMERADTEHKGLLREINECSIRNQTSENHVVQRIDKLENWNVWTMRTIVGAIIVAVLAAIGLTAG